MPYEDWFKVQIPSCKPCLNTKSTVSKTAIESLILKWKKEAEYSETYVSEDYVSNTLNECIEDLQKLIK